MIANKLYLTITLFFVVCVLGNGCLTQTIWKGALENEYVIVYKDTLSSEVYNQSLAALKDGKKGILLDDKGNILIQKSRLRKSKDCVLASLATPITLTLDGVAIIIYFTVANSRDILAHLFL